MFFAHSENPRGIRHKLTDHLLGTAELARSFAPSEQLKPLFYLAGLLHDVGKFQDGFQEYLLEGGRKTPHAGVGAFVASTLGRQLIPLQFVIKGHHAGMPDNEERKINQAECAAEQNLVKTVIARYEDCVGKVLGKTNDRAALLPKDILALECLTRFLFSALTDADWLDTENHFAPERAEARLSCSLDYDALLAALERKFAQLPSNGLINELRTRARAETAEHYSEALGFFSLQLPTGMGKTLTSLYWALLHARHQQLKRILIVLPYINIIDQTAALLKGLFGNDVVLEHHSGIVEEDIDYTKETIDSTPNSAKRLACENWDAPIIITTSVQFFESLFSNKSFKCRKNHNISESVVIFDEIQTLPKQYAEPIVVMLKNAVALIRTSFLFCTATQPAFKRREGFNGIENIRPLIEQPEKYFAPTQRVEYTLLNGLEEVSMDRVWEELANETGSYLAIVNTKSVARQLFERLEPLRIHDRCYHLSTAMCPHHRKKAIANIVFDLDPKSGKRIAVISTQLVEAGVDFDFPCVYRAMAPLDGLIQAAGRCNRNGLLDKGRVVLFDLERQKMPDKTYKACADWAKVMIKEDADVLHSATAFERYYEAVTKLFVDRDRYDITNERREFNFKTVAESFKIIDSPTVPLYIKDYSDESRVLIEQVARNRFVTKENYRQLQQYSVQVYPKFLEDFKGQIVMEKDLIRIWLGHYDNNIGLDPQDVKTVF